MERKRLDDLCSSIIDGRFREQKVPLLASPQPLLAACSGGQEESRGTSGWLQGRAPTTPATPHDSCSQAAPRSDLGPLQRYSRCAGCLSGLWSMLKTTGVPSPFSLMIKKPEAPGVAPQ